MAMVAAELPMICRPFVGGLRKNGVGWNWCRGLHGLPQDGSVSYLRNSVNGAEVYLVGTCHIAAKSAQLVKEVIGRVDPNIIAVELCYRRFHSLQHLKSYQPSFLKLLLDSWRFPGTLRVKLRYFSYHLGYRMLRGIGIEPYKEFMIALDEYKRLEAQFYLIDEDVNVVRKKLDDLLSSIPFLRRINLIKLLQQFDTAIQIEEYLEKMTQRNFIRKRIKKLTCASPEIVRVILTERDQMMCENLRKCKGKVVAVVGMAHMDGIEQMWKETEQNLWRIDWLAQSINCTSQGQVS